MNNKQKTPNRRMLLLPVEYSMSLVEFKCNESGKVTHRMHLLRRNSGYVGFLNEDCSELTCGLTCGAFDLTMKGVTTKRVKENKVPTVSVKFDNVDACVAWCEQVKWENYNGVMLAVGLKPE